MSEQKEIIFKKVDDKTIVWFEKTNQYVVLENTTADILKRLSKGITYKDIGIALSKKLHLPVDKTIDFVLNIEHKLFLPNTSENKEIINDYRDYKTALTFQHTRYYKINNYIFKVQSESEHELSLIHPKFAHLEIKSSSKFDFCYIAFTQNNYTFLIVDDKFIGAWSQKEIHYFEGKFSMQIVQHIHQKEEKEWLGVFHASAVSDNQKSMLFLGDSGNGKSTSLALLQANGFNCLADDFVPVAIENNEVYSFPSAISIKKNSVATLLPIYPELKDAAEFHFKRLNKVVRYLPPNNATYDLHLPCKALVFIKYEKDSDLHFNLISKTKAFENLVPDSWLSPIQKNAQQFLDWFEKLDCYQLTYSNNEEMISKVSKLFSNDL